MYGHVLYLGPGPSLVIQIPVILDPSGFEPDPPNQPSAGLGLSAETEQGPCSSGMTFNGMLFVVKQLQYIFC